MKAIAVLLLLLTSLAPALAAETVRLSGERVAIFNLAGQVRIEPGTGDAVEVEIARGGADGGELRWETISRRVGKHEVGSTTALVIHYPSDNLRYTGGSGSSSVQLARDGTFFDGSGMRRVNINQDAAGFLGRLFSRGPVSEAHADLVVRVPAGVTTAMFLAVGEIRADGVRADLVLGTGAARVEVADHEGRLVADTGSGRVQADRIMGEVWVDTGSGAVALSEVRSGKVWIDTGSGRVSLSDVRGDTLRVDTGSGSVRADALDFDGHVDIDTGSGSVQVEGVKAGSLRVDTGSGSVVLKRLEGGETVIDTGSGRVTGEDATITRLHVDTGSGSVSFKRLHTAEVIGNTGSGRIELDLLSSPRSLRLKTGSGGMALTLPADYAASLELSTGSGRIQSDFPVHGEIGTRRVSGRIGEPGDARLQASTSSGGIRLRQR